MAETAKRGYYTQDSGQNVYLFYMGDEPPLEQYVLTGGAWVPLIDGYFLMDLLIDGDPTITSPWPDPPEII
jgi:hypothetical protein